MEITLLEKRTIEAGALAPVLSAFTRKLGVEKVREVMTEINMEASRQYGRDLAHGLGSATLPNWRVKSKIGALVIPWKKKCSNKLKTHSSSMSPVAGLPRRTRNWV